MQNPWLFLKENIEKSLKKEIGEVKIEVSEYGDFTLPCFSLAKKLGKYPKEIAEELSKKLEIEFTEIKPIGPYLNFYIDWGVFGGKILKLIDDKYGKNKIKKTVIVDFSSPNPAHPLHIGHARTTLLGESVSRILESQGYKIFRVNYINDIGKQLAKLAIGYKLYKKGEIQGKIDHWLWNFYVRFHKEKTPDLEKQVERFVYEYEKGDKKTRELGREVVSLCLKGFKQTYKKLGINFDEYIFESDFVEESKKIVEKCLKKRICFKKGSVVVDLEKHGLPNTVLLRSDGTGLYLTRDIATTIHKFKKYKPDLNIWVVGEEQNLFFKQEKKVLELLGYKKFSDKSYHLSYGMVNLEKGKMVSRLGKAVLIDEMIEKAEEKSLELIKEKSLSEKQKKNIAEKVGLSAIKYDILKISPEKSILFSWDRALKFEGDTGPYLLYTYARANSILRKAKIKEIKNYDSSLLKDKKEVLIIKLLAKYPEILRKSAKDLKPHYLANYLHELADVFNEFYQNIPVLKADKELKIVRLKLVESVKIILKNGLKFLGIDVLEKM